MLYRLLEDLRFVIGVFFALISCILAVTGFMNGTSLNIQVGGLMGIFAVCMIALSLKDLKRLS